MTDNAVYAQTIPWWKRLTPDIRIEFGFFIRDISHRIITAWLLWLASGGSGAFDHAEKELPPPDGKNHDGLQRQLLAHVALFGLAGHSGGSANPAIQALTRLLKQHPLGPLTGEANEWVYGMPGGEVRQNRRCSAVFADHRGAYTIDEVVFEEPWTNPETGKMTLTRYSAPSEGSLLVTFPYHVPERPTYVSVPADADREARLKAMMDAGIPKERILALRSAEAE